ncbi:hypothetical protein HK104_003945 [Borealophlyctis nickersoniae]|nr:hypothetical protein HK104_003945 [Borealophlyctis nickersoniae]
MKFTALALLATAASVSGAGIRFSAPDTGVVWQSGSNVTIIWTWDADGITYKNLPGINGTDVMTFVLEDLVNGENTGVPLGAPIGTAAMVNQSVTGPLPSVPAGKNYTIRGTVGTPEVQVFSVQFTIAGPAGNTTTTTVAAPTTTAATTTTVAKNTTTTTSAKPTTTAQSNSGAGGFGGNMAAYVVPAVVGAAAVFGGL